MRTKYNAEAQKSRQEFAKQFLRSYKEALDIGMGKKPKRNNLDNLLNELDKYIEEERKNGRD